MPKMARSFSSLSSSLLSLLSSQWSSLFSSVSSSSSLFWSTTLIIIVGVHMLVKECSATSTEMCRIQIQISELFSTSSQDVSMRGLLMDSSEVAVSLDSKYQVTCVTNEKVRTRNFVMLQWSNSSSSSGGNEKYRLISNATKNKDDLSYLRGNLTLKSSQFDSSHNLNIFCRFLTIDPSLYCEKTLRVKVYSNEELRQSVFRNLSLVVFVVGALSVLLKLSLNRFRSQTTTHKASSSSRHSSLSLPPAPPLEATLTEMQPPPTQTMPHDDDMNRSIGLVTSEPCESTCTSAHATLPLSSSGGQILRKIEFSEKFEKIEIKDRDDFDFSIMYPQSSTSQQQTMIITECNPDIASSSLRFSERLID